MLEALKAVDYKKVFYFFSELAAIPHGSGNVGAMADYLENFAKERNIRYNRDSADNIIFYKPATEGYEALPTVILQGHMDMVCEKDPKRGTKGGIMKNHISEKGYRYVRLSTYFTFGLTSFPQIAENPAINHFPFSNICFHTCTLPVFLPVSFLASLVWPAFLVPSTSFG